eukprot:25123-Karenia_brevis.AAC.1
MAECLIAFVASVPYEGKAEDWNDAVVETFKINNILEKTDIESFLGHQQRLQWSPLMTAGKLNFLK